MNLVLWSPIKGGSAHRQFKSERKAKDFARNVCKQAFGGFSYMTVWKHRRSGYVQQYRNGVVTYHAPYRNYQEVTNQLINDRLGVKL